ncbi:MAG: ammonium transporter [Opitutales bacterium]
MKKLSLIFGFIVASMAIFAQTAAAEEAVAATEAVAEAAEATISQEMFTINNIWILISAALVFIMHPGFAMVEIGLTRAKNTVNILTKNVSIVAIGVVTYAIMGFNLMYPGDFDIIGGVLGFAGFGISHPADYVAIEYYGGCWTYLTDFMFQAMFCATSATIVSGAVAERIKLSSFLAFSAIFVSLVYTTIGSWGWGGGWLSDLGFHDLAGSTFVHAVGGWAALAGAIMVGPRIGKYIGGKAQAIPGHNMGAATLGVFLLFFGWFGFNGGSWFSAEADPVSLIFVTTAMAASTGLLCAMFTSWFVQKKPDLSMALNGCLAGLVGITAGADCVSIMSAAIIGAIAGVLVVFSVFFFDKIKVDDPVGALSVHLVCGIWGTLAVGLFPTIDATTFGPAADQYSFMTQLIGVIATGAASFSAAMAVFFVLKKTIGLRVHKSEELIGLDLSEHGMEAYSGFQIFSNQ